MSLSTQTPQPSPQNLTVPPRVDDSKLVYIIDAALAYSVERSGEWLACKPGCSQCCAGVFAISQLDARRLREGLQKIAATDPVRANNIRERARGAMARLAPKFPGDPKRGLLGEAPEDEERFEEFANDEPCPALDPENGHCELYTSRPITCRIFGPPVRTAEGLGVCELCFQGATVDEMAACEMIVDPDDLEAALLAELERTTGLHGSTIIPYVLAEEEPPTP